MCFLCTLNGVRSIINRTIKKGTAKMALHAMLTGTGKSNDLPNTPDVLMNSKPRCKSIKFLVVSFTASKSTISRG